MKIFPNKQFFSVLLSVQTIFFRLHLSADNFFCTRVSNQWSRLVIMMMIMMVILIIIIIIIIIINFLWCFFSFLFTPRLTGYGMHPVSKFSF